MSEIEQAMEIAENYILDCALKAQLDRERETESDELIDALCSHIKQIYLDAYEEGREGGAIFEDGLEGDIYLGVKAIFDKYYEPRKSPIPSGLKIRTVQGEEFEVRGNVTWKDFPECGKVYYCAGSSFPESIVVEVLKEV